jgi:hypothetical protein
VFLGTGVRTVNDQELIWQNPDRVYRPPVHRMAEDLLEPTADSPLPGPGAADFVVTQFGARRLWDEMEAAYLCWLRSGAPGRERYGITVDAAGSQMWLDNPENAIGLRRISEYRR